jgi:uncharacterized protein (DUF302 family)
MDYYFSTLIKNKSFEEAVQQTTYALKQEGFGVLSEVVRRASLRLSLGVD